MQFPKGVEQLSNLENISWGRVSCLGKSPQGKVYDSMPVYLPLIKSHNKISYYLLKRVKYFKCKVCYYGFLKVLFFPSSQTMTYLWLKNLPEDRRLEAHFCRRRRSYPKIIMCTFFWFLNHKTDLKTSKTLFLTKNLDFSLNSSKF